MHGIGSVSKVFPAMAAMKLVDRARSISTPARPVSTRISAWPRRNILRSPCACCSIIRRALGDRLSQRFHQRAVPGYAAQVQQSLATQRLKHLPGEMAVYCNDCLTMIEPLVAAVSGRSYTQFVEDEISRRWTRPVVLRWSPSRRARSRQAIQEIAPIPRNTPTPYATGGLYSTPNDMAHLAMMFMNGGRLGMSAFVGIVGG